jgi:hypothetical protein
VLGRKKDSQDESAHEDGPRAESAEQQRVRAAEQRKNRPTPTRKEREAARRQPLAPTARRARTRASRSAGERVILPVVVSDAAAVADAGARPMRVAALAPPATQAQRRIAAPGRWRLASLGAVAALLLVTVRFRPAPRVDAGVGGEGGRVGGYTVQSIEAGKVTLAGPGGPQVLRPAFDARAPGAAPPLGAGPPGVPAALPGAAKPPAAFSPVDVLQSLRGLPGVSGGATAR